VMHCDFVAAFENGSLCNEDYHSADPIRVAFLCLCRFPILEVLERCPQARQRFAEARGEPNPYHETITWAFLFLIRERLVAQSSRQGRRQPSWEFTAESPDLLKRESNSILRDYCLDDRLWSCAKTLHFAEPHPSQISWS
jgi:hypothetical protein